MTQKLISTNPSRNYEAIGAISVSSINEIRAAVSAAHRAKLQWQALGVEGRASLLRQVIGRFRKRSEEMASLIAQEMGMPIREARDDVVFALKYLETYIEQLRLC